MGLCCKPQCREGTAGKVTINLVGVASKLLLLVITTVLYIIYIRVNTYKDTVSCMGHS